MPPLHHLSALEQLDGLRRGEWTPLELVEHYLGRIEALNPELGAFAVVTPGRARERAAVVAATPSSAILWGLPSAEKDLVARAGVPSRFGSRAFADHVPENSDELTDVLDGAGAVSLGRTTSPEFGFSSYTEPLAGPISRNPYDPAVGAGGSSGGAAVAVAAGLLPAAIGSDGGGSVRIPAAVTGLVGLKPARGRIPAGSGFGTLAGLAVPGPLARTVADAALLLDALVAGGRYDWATAAPRRDVPSYLDSAVRGEGRFSIGVTRDSPWSTTYPVTIAAEAEAALAVAIEELAALGHGIDDLHLEPEEGYAPAFRTIWQAGAGGVPLDGEKLSLLEPLTRWLVERGRALGARELGEALAWLAAFERRFIAQLHPFDAVLTPVLATTPPPVGWYDAHDPERNFAQQVQVTPFTSMVNVSGLPAISLPVSTTAQGIPMAVQLIAGPGREDVLFSIGAQLERRLAWQHRHPPGW